MGLPGELPAMRHPAVAHVWPEGLPAMRHPAVAHVWPEGLPAMRHPAVAPAPLPSWLESLPWKAFQSGQTVKAINHWPQVVQDPCGLAAP